MWDNVVVILQKTILYNSALFVISIDNTAHNYAISNTKIASIVCAQNWDFFRQTINNSNEL